MRAGALAFLLGILALEQARELPDPGLGLLLLPLVIAALACPRLRLPAAFVLGGLWALARAGLLLAQGVPPAVEGELCLLRGEVVGLPRPMERGLSFDLEVEAMQCLAREWPTPGRVRLRWYDADVRLIPGERWELATRLKRPRGFMNPGGFDYEGWLVQQAIRGLGYVIAGPRNRRLDEASGRWIDRLRLHLAEGVAEGCGARPHCGVVSALALGVAQEITPDEWRVFNRTGTSHLVAISGLHVGLIAALGFLAGRWLWSLWGRGVLYVAAPRVGAITGLLCAFLYAGLAGFSIPTQRTVIMLAVVMLGTVWGRGIARVDLLAIALVMVLILDPAAVLAPGFWLSFGAVALILFGMSGRVQATGIWWRIGRLHWVVGLGLTPLLLFFFAQNPLVGPLANVVAVPWVSFVVVPLVLLGTGLLELSGTGAAAMLTAAVMCLDWLWVYLHWLAQFDYASWQRPIPEVRVVAAATVGVLILLVPRGIPARWIGLVWLLPLIAEPPLRPAAGELWLTVLDVGQGLAVVARTGRHVLVYDTGPRLSSDLDTGRVVVAPFLRQQGITHIDTLIISHGDNDHIGGLKSLHEEISVGTLLSSVPKDTGYPGTAACRRGQRWRWEGIGFAMLHPAPGSPGRENDRSCVLQISIGDLAVLLPGDIEAGAEEVLVRRYGARLRSQVLVAPHHGSKSSSSLLLLDAVDPRYVVYSSGYRNRYGFPHREVAERYQERGTIALTTAASGAVTFRIGTRVGQPLAYRQQAARYWHSR